MKTHTATNASRNLEILLVILSVLLSAYQLPLVVKQEVEPTVEPSSTVLVEEQTIVPTEQSLPSTTFTPTNEPTASATLVPTEDFNLTPTEISTSEPTLDVTETPTITPTIEPSFTPTYTPTLPLETFEFMAASESGLETITGGGRHTCAITSIGKVKCWGQNDYGQLGDDSITSRHNPVDVIGLSSGVIAISSSGAHTCALITGGSVKCWGSNYGGTLGDGTTIERHVPVDVVGLTTGVMTISAGMNNSCAITSSGGVKCWGSNSWGEVGDGTNTDRIIPIDVVGLSSGVIAISVGQGHSCAVTAIGAVKCWGWNMFGQLGDGTKNDSNIPVDVVGLSSGVIAISAGDMHTCALTSGGGVKCWGENYIGQLGNGTTKSSVTPVNVSGLTSGVLAIAAGGVHNCAITATGAVKCWGYNESGQLGDKTRTTRLSPVVVFSISSGGKSVTAGGDHSCAFTLDGNVKCWGLNDFGQLGDGTTTNRLSPVDVVGFVPLKYPIILLPGVMGSRLVNSPQGGEECSSRQNKDGEVWFLNKSDFLLKADALYLNSSSPTPLNGCDRISPAGIMDSGETDAYSNTINVLKSAGYQVYPFAYDWRLNLEDSATKLDQFIDETLGITNSTRVVIIGHSMGGVLARTYIANTNRANKVSQIISIGSPYWGSPKMSLTMRSGGMMDDEYRILKTDFYLALPAVANIARNSPGAMQLLPSEYYINDPSAGYYYIDDQTPLTTWESTKNFFVTKTGKRGIQNAQLLESSKVFQANYLNTFQNLPAGLDYHILTTDNLPTISKIREYPCQFVLLPDTCYEVGSYLDGDGTVPYPSASMPGKTGIAVVDTFHASEVGDLEHGDQMQDTSVIIPAILNILQGEPAKAAAQESFAAQDSSSQTFIQLSVQGDAEVSVRNSINQFLGLDSSGIVINEIPGSDYTLYENQTIVVLPSGQPYTVTLKQLGSYPLQVKVTDFLSPATGEAYTPNQRAVFIDIPSSPDGVATLPLDLSQGLNSLQLSLDQNNDGTPEQALPPTSVLNQEQSQDISMPVTTISISGAKDSLDFFTGPVTATLSAIDTGAGVLKTEYSLDGGTTWLLYSAPVNFTAEDVQMFHTRSVDIAGNQEYPWPFEQIRPFNVTGKVTNPHGLPTTEITVSDGNGHTAVVDSEGNYVLDGLRVGSFTVTPSMAEGSFTPVSSTVTVGPNGTGYDFAINAPLPKTTEITPDMKYTGNPNYSLIIKGADFLTSSIVRWNGYDRPTTFVNSSQLTAEISAADVATAGAVNVTVFTPAPGGGTSNPQPFYITLSGKGPAIPVLSKPATNSILGNLIPMLTISSAARAVKYHFQVSTLDTFETLIVNEITASKNYSITHAIGLEWGKDYYWRVRSIDNAGARSGWSGFRKFTFNIQVSPPNGSNFTGRLIKTNGPSISTNRITFRWSSPSPRLLHNIQVSTNADFTSLVIDQNIQSSNSFNTLLPKGTYYWRMRFKIGEEWSAFMPAWKFSVNIK